MEPHPTPQNVDFNEFKSTLSEAVSTKVKAFLSKLFLYYNGVFIF